MGEYLRQVYEKARGEWFVDQSKYRNSVEELNDLEKRWRKEHRKELQQSLNKLKSTILQEKSNDNK